MVVEMNECVKMRINENNVSKDDYIYYECLGEFIHTVNKKYFRRYCE